MHYDLDVHLAIRYLNVHDLFADLFHGQTPFRLGAHVGPFKDLQHVVRCKHTHYLLGVTR
jgi:hypothetical protein